MGAVGQRWEYRSAAPSILTPRGDKDVMTKSDETSEQIFEIAFDLEDDVRIVHDLAVVVARFAESLDGQDGSALGTLAWAIIDKADDIQDQRTTLCRLLETRETAVASGCAPRARR